MLTKPTPRFVAIQSSYWACYCCIISFSSVYLLDRGFSNAQVGLVISLGGLLSALLQPRVSRAADRLRKLSLRLFCAGVAGIALVASAGLLCLPGKLPQLVLYGSLVVLVQLLMPLCSALGMACLNLGYRLNFGLARGAGSMAFGIFSAACGRLVLWLGAWSVAAAMLVMQAVLFAAFRPRPLASRPRNQSQRPPPLKLPSKLPSKKARRSCGPTPTWASSCWPPAWSSSATTCSIRLRSRSSSISAATAAPWAPSSSCNPSWSCR